MQRDFWANELGVNPAEASAIWRALTDEQLGSLVPISPILLIGWQGNVLVRVDIDHDGGAVTIQEHTMVDVESFAVSLDVANDAGSARVTFATGGPEPLLLDLSDRKQEDLAERLRHSARS
jgi:hypothetical protein